MKIIAENKMWSLVRDEKSSLFLRYGDDKSAKYMKIYANDVEGLFEVLKKFKEVEGECPF